MSSFLPKTVQILFGSETGNAEDVAFSLNDDLQKAGYSSRVLSFSEYDMTDLPEEDYVVFVCSTTGDGELPMSMKKPWMFLMRKTLPAGCLSSLNFAVFGLGDSSYDKFNFVSRKLHARLKQLGANEILPLGLGDDQAKYGYFSAYNTWAKQLHSFLASQPRLKKSVLNSDLNESTDNSPVYDISLASSVNFEAVAADSQKASGGDDHILQCSVVDNTRMTTATWDQDVRHLKLSIDRRGATEADSASERSTNYYQPGDIAEVFYTNPVELVHRAIARIVTNNEHNNQYTAETALTLTRNTTQYGVRMSRVSHITTTVFDLFHRVLDIYAIPKRSFFLSMARFASSAEERDKLLELGSALGTDLYFDYCIREKRCFIEVLEEFPSVHPPLSAFLDAVPVIQPRQYSIASSESAVGPGQLELCVAVKKSVTPYRRQRFGLCSGYIASLAPGDKVRIRLKHGVVRDTAIGKMVNALLGSAATNSNLVLSADAAAATTAAASSAGVNIILVGPGTGIAPMRSIVQHYQAACGGSAGDVAVPAGDGMNDDTKQSKVQVFFGCRRRNQDYLFGTEWEAIRNSNSSINSSNCSNVAVDVAFSQEQLKKDYVTHSIKRNGAQVYEMLQRPDCCVFVSGSAKRMPADVRKAFVSVLVDHSGGELDAATAEEVLNRMVRSKRYLVEAWN